MPPMQEDVLHTLFSQSADTLRFYLFYLLSSGLHWWVLGPLLNGRQELTLDSLIFWRAMTIVLNKYFFIRIWLDLCIQIKKISLSDLRYSSLIPKEAQPITHKPQETQTQRVYFSRSQDSWVCFQAWTHRCPSTSKWRSSNVFSLAFLQTLGRLTWEPCFNRRSLGQHPRDDNLAGLEWRSGV